VAARGVIREEVLAFSRNLPRRELIVMHCLHGWREVLPLLVDAVRSYMKVIEANKAPRTGSSASKAQERGFIMNVARSFNNWRKYRQTVSELGRMTSRELQDLGIDRSDIHSVARAAIAR
jgi:uncharacterized protein YjiS (DUF1127 family)